MRNKEKKIWVILGLLMMLSGVALSFILLAEMESKKEKANTDYHNHYLSQKIGAERLAELEREAKEEWIEEFGDIPRNMTSDELFHAKAYVEGR